MSNTANTQEPTMEEILASIRRIISEDNEEAPKAEAPKKPAAAAAAAPAPKPAPVKAAPAPPPPVEEDDDEVLELTDIVAEEPPPPPRREPVIDDDVVMVDREPPRVSAPRPSPRPMPPRTAEPEEGLLTDRVRDRASVSFATLERNVNVSNVDPRSLEALVQEMLRPMLEDWLNQNLPAIVERLVQQEIDRVSRKGRF